MELYVEEEGRINWKIVILVMVVGLLFGIFSSSVAEAEDNLDTSILVDNRICARVSEANGKVVWFQGVITPTIAEYEGLLRMKVAYGVEGVDNDIDWFINACNFSGKFVGEDFVENATQPVMGTYLVELPLEDDAMYIEAPLVMMTSGEYWIEVHLF